MYTFMRLTQIYNSSDFITFDDNSKFVFFSDCHRGDKSNADNFLKNRDIYLYSLDFYYSNGFTYIELGDGDELWENDRFSTLVRAHTDAYLLLQKFYLDKRLYMIWGNHDIFKSYKNYVKNTLFKYYDLVSQSYKPLFDNIKIHEGLILKYNDIPRRIFVVHGHQGDILNDIFWPFSRFIIRHFWRLFEILHNRSHISQVRNKARLQAFESSIKQWCESNKQMVIAGHTHKPAFALPGQIPYFNDGCCVKKGYITCLEIENGEILLVKWMRNVNSDGSESITKEVLAGPAKISDYFKDNQM
ncbi:MAG: metallophosphoesterase [Bacillota bacterium]|nr:metallophosphoesterase [Bacillota bacterium]